MAREIKEDEAEVAPFWMISFSDLMSLLLSFFIMLFSMSTLEKDKMEQMVKGMGDQFGGEGAGAAAVEKWRRKRAENEPAAVLTGDKKRRGAVLIPSKSPDAVMVKGGLIVFDYGSDELSEAAGQSLEALQKYLKGSPYKLSVRGHAGHDEAGPYRDVDDLAYTRAWTVRKHLVALGIDRNLFEINVVGATEPLNPLLYPDIPDARQINSYVEVMLLDTFAVNPKPASAGLP
ncbi:MAG TPA: hypothetical protein DEB39_02370 [Planctomycetaceae bacterium]|nr:hypothetical protein [Planctomycetaceae bacterium]